jgi:hypothetical protein
MDRTKIKNTSLMPLVCLTLAAGPVAAVECTTGVNVPVKGKITNNLQPGGAISTVGTLDIKLKDIGKMRCGLVGQPAPSGTPPADGGIGFTHTISCDDEVLVNHPYFGDLVAHSQLTLDTQGQLSNIQYCNYMDASGGVSASFVEESTPQVFMGGSTGRGLFTGVTEGKITIEGTINCVGSVDMKFHGEICLLPQ